ncbi:hypothetical protein SUGI_0863090 [Cryptomeria japonica]|uniref:transcriptional regulator TAC1-like n=1 Tax=Cryptomeria japonica TaxID=3369 RepID=UPI002414CB8A|nr:transcriptional regulator TAC1-like [Cryptomeria japonica]GLJ41702.1 hypothetical protein SUGI_0863090 [Cryptomeria japonica]
MPFHQIENEEVQQNGEQANEAAGHMEQVASGPSGQNCYECMFCKRGFSRAEALGGHMNIHRRHRALPMLSSLVVCDRGPRSSSPLPSLSSPAPYDQAASFSLVSNLWAGHSSEEYIREKTCDRVQFYSYSESFDENPQMNAKGKEMGSSEDDEEVDLELRLGQSPAKKLRLNLPYLEIL